MKNIKFIVAKWSIIAACTHVGLLLLSGCASTDKQGQGQGQQDDMGQNQENGSEESQDAPSNGSLNGQAEAVAGENGAAINNAVDESTPEGQNAGGEGENAMGFQGNAAPTENIAATNSASLNAAPTEGDALLQDSAQGSAPMNAAAGGMNAALAAPTNAAPPTDGAAPIPAATPALPPIDPLVWESRGRVKYAKRTVTKHASPGGPVVGEYVQGDHPLVLKQGEWDQIQNGTFVESSGLSLEGVGRSKTTRQWK